MMNIVNSRMAYTQSNITNLKDAQPATQPTSVSTDHQRPVFSTTDGGISVTREEWRDEESLSPGQGAAEGLTIAGKHSLPADSGTNA